MVTMSSEYSIYLYREKVGLRKGISGLKGIVRYEMKMKMNPNTAKSIMCSAAVILELKRFSFTSTTASN